jgi:hypothetical protein
MRMRFSIFPIFVLLVALSGCATGPSIVQQPVVPSESFTPSIAGTTWVGTDSDGDYYEYYFQTDGIMHYKSPAGFFWKNGTWKQDKSSIYMEMNNRYAEYQGVITGTRMEGQGWNTKGRKWTWVAEKR